MSAESSRAVFLSYASQDAESVQRIADALRAAGVEVWFDKNELVGGDAWDAKIRKQIAECALFVPIISAATQTRREGYFRLEWRLAAQRTHMMSESIAFLLPVVIDATRDTEADVPSEFKSVQWTRLPNGEAPEKFCARVKQLLGGVAPIVAGVADPGPASTRPATTKRSWLMPAVIGVTALVALAFWQPWKKSATTTAPAATATTPTAPLTEARKLVAQALALIDDPDYVRENFRLAEELCNQALALDKTDAEVWAAAARVSEEMTYNAYDRSPQRREQSRTLAERAVRLAPKSLNARLAVARNVSLNGDYAEAVRLLRALLAEAPSERLVLRELLHAERATENDAGAKEMVARIRALPGGDPVALIYEARDLDLRGRFPEAEAIADQLLAESPIRMAYYTKLFLLARYWSDVPATRDFIQKIPPRLLADDGFAAMVAEFWMRAGDSEKALAALAKVSHEMLQEFATYQPKGLLTGWAFTMAGRPAAAQAEWQRALAAVEQRLVAEPNQESLLGMKGILQAQLGQKAAARETWNLLSELVAAAGAPVNRYATGGGARFAVAMGENEEAILNLVQRWPSMSFATRSLFVSDLRDAPFLAPIRHDPRVEQLINEHTAALEMLRHGEKKPAVTSAVSLDEKAVAVLPFANLSGDKEQEYFSDGLTEEILNALARERDLRVPGRTSSFSFKGKNATPAEIASALNVSRLVEGSVQRAGTKVRIRVSLTRVADNASEEVGTFTEELADIFALQDKVARAVVEKLTHRQVASGVEVLTKNPEAYDCYLRGRALQTRAGSYSHEAAKLYEQAVALDPKFALAWARLAEARFRNYNSGSDHSPAVVAGAREAIDRALASHPDLPEALLARASLVRAVEYDFVSARRDLDQAQSLRGSTAELLWSQATLARDVGNWPDAVRLARESLELDPQNGDNANVYGFSFCYFRGDFAEADRLLARATAIQGLTAETPLGSRVLSRLAWRGPEAARRLVDRQPAAQAGIAWMRAWVLAQLGRMEESRTVLEAAAGTAQGVAQPSPFWFVRELSVAEAVGLNGLARKWAEGILANVEKEFARGNRASEIHELRVHAEISLGHRDVALADLEEWRGEGQRMPSAYRRMTEYQRRAALAYGRLGKADEAVALLRELDSDGFWLSGYSLRCDLAYAPIRNDARFQELMRQAEARAKAQPDPSDL